MLLIPSGVIDDIRNRCDIEDVISSYITLKRAGSNLKGLCPFHSEKTPSFVVYKDTQSFYCFGCGAGGDVISFIMKQENLDYVSAVEFLARRAGVALPESDDFSNSREVGRARILKMNVEAAKFFRTQLFDERNGIPAREYLIGKRHLGTAAVKHFGLGWAPPDWHSLRDHLYSLGFTESEVLAADLCRKGERSVYDSFRGRVIFPIIDVSGNIVAFGGRVLDDSKPKYLNSSETPAFKKSKNLFALNFAKNSDEDSLILCEGYMDVVSMHAAGFTNAVATLGTAVTPEHARIIKRYVSKVILAYDGDAAGQRAAEKAMRYLADAGVDYRMLVIDGAKDPDEYIKKYGREAFRRLLDESRSKFYFLIEKICSGYNLENADEKVKAASALCSEIASVQSSVEREIFITKAAEALSLDRRSIESDVNFAIRRSVRQAKKKQSEELIRVTSGLSDRVNRDMARMPRAARIEESIIGVLMTHPEYTLLKCGGEPLSKEDFMTEYGGKLFSFISDRYSDGGFVAGQLHECFGEDEVSRAVKLQTERRGFSDSEEAYIKLAEALRAEARMDAAESLEDIINSKRQNS